MPIIPIVWVVVPFIAGVAATGAIVSYFWESIKAWATKVVGVIIDAINSAIEVSSRAVIYLLKQGRRFYKKAEVYIKNVYSGRIERRYKQEEVSEYDIPEEILAELNQRGGELKLMQQG